MKIGLIRETKSPVDNRVALSPEQVAGLNKRYPAHEIVVEKSPIRSFSDEEYERLGVRVVDNVGDCDVLFGIKESAVDSLIPDKTYFFFGHVAKKQRYNLPLLQAMMSKRITFCDYEYLVDANHVRVCAFGWWAGIVGVYYTLRGYGLKYGLFELPQPTLDFTLDRLLETLKRVELPKVKMFVTGAGRVSQGARFLLDSIGADKMTESDYLVAEGVNRLSYCFADVDGLVRRKDGGKFSWDDFTHNTGDYESDFMRWAKTTDVLICAHFWSPDAPVYLDETSLRSPELRIKMIGDVTCDIKGSVKSTVRSSTHSEPFYDYNPYSECEEAAFSSTRNITVMAVDTCPNALARDTSAFFGEALIGHVFEPLLQGKIGDVIEGSVILSQGKLTPKFSYLQDFADGK